MNTQTIVACATSPGRGGIGIVRVSGPLVKSIAQGIVGAIPTPRQAHFCQFLNMEQQVIDEGVVLYFPAPHSFTGEDILELQAHGSPVVLAELIDTCTKLGARHAKPGEFSERAFLNNKMDLTQAEAIADLIDSTSVQAARSALRSLQGEFSKLIHNMRQQIIKLRTYVEAAIDFADEDIEFIEQANIAQQLMAIQQELLQTQQAARQGVILRDGLTMVIAGRPNVGKSSLLNCLSGRESAIVSEIAGTTRDVMREHIHLKGIPLHIIDTAGIHASSNQIELEGIKRARQEISNADLLLYITDCRDPLPENIAQAVELATLPQHVMVVRNKIDLTQQSPMLVKHDEYHEIFISAKQQLGIDVLRETLYTQLIGMEINEGSFIARQRHLDALRQAFDAIARGLLQLQQYRAADLLADDLVQAQKWLDEITGEYLTSDDLLGRIFSTFCVGK